MSDLPPDLHPEHRALLSENARLRDELTRLLVEENDLIKVVRPNLLALYQQKIGVWELRALQAQVKMTRLRRTFEMGQASINHGEVPNRYAIDTALEKEFLLWTQRLAEAMQTFESAQLRLGSLLLPADSQELRKLYRALVRQLHPDLNGSLTAHQKNLWEQVQNAYEMGDLPGLRALSLLVGDFIEREAPSGNALETLRGEITTLQSQIEVISKRIADERKKAPHILREKLEDEEWLTTRREEIELLIEEHEANSAMLEKELQKIFPPLNHGPVSGLN